MWELIERLYPICRSITGDGVRETLAILAEHIPIEMHEIPSGTRVLDWTVPPEWNIRDAFVADRHGNRVIDFRESNLHVVSYSVPVRARMTLEELRPHLHSLPDHPNLVPYRTSYYEESWGFCVSENAVRSMTEGEYEVVIDSSLEPGAMTYGECVVPGSRHGEVLISAHVCHPSLCDDNLTGIAVATTLAALLTSKNPPRHTFRFLFAPGTIGAIAWLATNRAAVGRLIAGLTLSCLGDSLPFTYKRTEAGNALVDRAAELVLRRSSSSHDVIDFFPYGYDERQYNSPGFRAPVGSLMRGRHGQFDEYHTSADDMDFISRESLVQSLRLLENITRTIDRDRTMRNLAPHGEPQLGSRGLYRALGGSDIPGAQLAMLWVLNQSDGATTLLDIARRSGMPFESIDAAADLLERHGLLQEIDPEGQSVPTTLEDRTRRKSD
jgi:aminopeptidase-like protein